MGLSDSEAHDISPPPPGLLTHRNGGPVTQQGSPWFTPCQLSRLGFPILLWLLEAIHSFSNNLLIRRPLCLRHYAGYCGHYGELVEPTLPARAHGLFREVDVDSLLQVSLIAHAVPVHRRHTSSRCHICLWQQETHMLSQARAWVSGSASSFPSSRTVYRRQKLPQGVGG